MGNEIPGKWEWEEGEWERDGKNNAIIAENKFGEFFGHALQVYAHFVKSRSNFKYFLSFYSSSLQKLF